MSFLVERLSYRLRRNSLLVPKLRLLVLKFGLSPPKQIHTTACLYSTEIKVLLVTNFEVCFVGNTTNMLYRIFLFSINLAKYDLEE